MKNVEIDEGNNEVILNMNPEFYDYEAIMITSKEFSENFWVFVDKIQDNIQVNIKPKPEFVDDVDLKELGYEFYNFTLGLMQNSAAE
ncbi:hypothetical protein ISS07_06295 [Candidatus Woesearchaeota archaeon]|nr:hypothetical protein [Candidatus Woesearchaeota archaeon]